jgi:hypothetical protein
MDLSIALSVVSGHAILYILHDSKHPTNRAGSHNEDTSGATNFDFLRKNGQGEGSCGLVRTRKVGMSCTTNRGRKAGSIYGRTNMAYALHLIYPPSPRSHTLRYILSTEGAPPCSPQEHPTCRQQRSTPLASSTYHGGTISQDQKRAIGPRLEIRYS